MNSGFEELLNIFNRHEVRYLMSIDGLTFEDAWPNRNQSTFGGVTAWFISRADLIKNKRTSARHIDLHDADLLE
jgi:hypothetical protein